MKLNELKMRMKEIKKELINDVVKAIEFKDSEYKIHNILINRRDDNAISIIIMCYKERRTDRLSGYIGYYDNDKIDYRKHSKQFKEAVSNSDQILNIVFNKIKNNKAEINNLLDEYINIEYKLMLQIREAIKFKKSNVSNVDLCDPAELEFAKLGSSDINTPQNTFHISLPLKAITDRGRTFNELGISLKDGVVKGYSWYFDSSKDIFEDSVENIDEINKIVENFIKEN